MCFIYFTSEGIQHFTENKKKQVNLTQKDVNEEKNQFKTKIKFKR